MRTLFATSLVLATFFSVPLFAVAITCPSGCYDGGDGNCYTNNSGAVCTNPSPTINQNPSPTINSGTGVTLINPLKATNLNDFLMSILDFVIQIGTVVVILMTVFVGFKFVTAGGEPGEITKARQALLWTVVGALILLGAKAISIGIQATVKALTLAIGN